MNQKLYILGSNKIFPEIAVKFIGDCGQENPVIMILLSGEKYLNQLREFYSKTLNRFRLQRINFIFPDRSGIIDKSRFLEIIPKIKGLIIGGGSSLDYYCNYVKSPFDEAIRSAYNLGIPVMGCSGGALITPAIYPIYSETGELIRFVPGLGLTKNFIIQVHFNQQSTLPHLLNEMSTSETENAIGVDENSCGVFSNNQLAETIGKPIFWITMNDFKVQTYHIVEV